MVKVFFSYAQADEPLRQKLDDHLAVLRRQGAIESWDTRQISAGQDIVRATEKAIQEAEVILLLVSPALMASDYCYDNEVGKALERHSAGTARVVPIILKHCDWEFSPIGALRALPENGKPIVAWADVDEAFKNIVTGIRDVINTLGSDNAATSDALVPASQNVTPPQFKVETSLRAARLHEDRLLEKLLNRVKFFFRARVDELNSKTHLKGFVEIPHVDRLELEISNGVTTVGCHISRIDHDIHYFDFSPRHRSDYLAVIELRRGEFFAKVTDKKSEKIVCRLEGAEAISEKFWEFFIGLLNKEWPGLNYTGLIER